MEKIISIAIDGPCAVGKGPLARRLANHFKIKYLETGLLYRKVALDVFKHGIDPYDKVSTVNIAKQLNFDDLTNPELMDENIGIVASKIATLPEIRSFLLNIQREYIEKPPGAVLDGRDIGTIVLPNAQFKFYLTGSIDSRVDRRYKELMEKGKLVNRKKVHLDMIERDNRDQSRLIAPLLPASNALIIDTSGLRGIEIFSIAMNLIKESKK